MSSEERADFLARSVAALVAWVAPAPVGRPRCRARPHARHRPCSPTPASNTTPSATTSSAQTSRVNSGGRSTSTPSATKMTWSIVVEGGNREQMSAALDAVAARRQEAARPLRPGLSPGRSATPPRPRPSLSTARTARCHSRPPRSDGTPASAQPAPLAWRMLSVQSLFASAEGALNARAAGRELSAADRDLLAQLPAVATSAADTLRDPAAYRNPWSLGSANPEGERPGRTRSTAVLLHAGRFARDADLPASNGGAVVHPREGGERCDARHPRRGGDASSRRQVRADGTARSRNR